MIEKTDRRPGSEREFQRAARVIPGGVNSPARAFGAVGGTPPFIARGEGPFLVDIDGNRYLDYIGSWGPHLFGHGYPPIVAAIRAAAETGTSFGAPTVAESELAELIISLVPSIEKVRMVNSGTEATMSAIRVARGFTDERDHQVCRLLSRACGFAAGSGGKRSSDSGAPSSPGVPAGCTSDTLVLPYNDVKLLEAAFQSKGSEIAAVILEPVVGNMGCVIPSDAFLKALRHLCTANGAVLIFDEVMTDFEFLREALRSCSESGRT